MTKPQPSVDLGYPTPAFGRIPAFNSIEEEAEFWDTHDVTDFLEESWPVQVRIGGALAEQRVMLRLEQADGERLARLAEAQGTDAATLARTWIEERLRQEPDAA